MYRFYIPSELILNSAIELDLEEMHHLKKVLRVRAGEKIELVNGKGSLAIALFDDQIVIHSVHTEPKPQKQALLIQAIPEKSHLEFILEKATEIGITDFWFFPSEKSKIREISPAFLSRMEKITISALKQCKRLFLPSITIYPRMENIKPPLFPLYLADPKGSPFQKPIGSAGFIIGPESGFTQKEIETFQTTCKAIPITLSNNILRTETASIVASFLIS